MSNNHIVKTRIAIFSSGRGTNTEMLIRAFREDSSVIICSIICNDSKAEVLNVAKKYSVASQVITYSEFYEKETVTQQLQSLKITHIVLAGFLWVVPKSIVNRYSKQIVNLHPSLLPKYGGKGMFGKHVHQAVKSARERKTGITIHLVNEKYDEGKVLFQISCDISPTDSVEKIEDKVKNLEHSYYHKIIRIWIDGGFET